MSARLQSYLDALVAGGDFSAVTALVGTADATDWTGSAGDARPNVPAGLATVYDYGSLAKPFAATLALVLDADNRLPLTTPVGEAFPETHRRLARRPLADLLRHRAGIAAWTPFYTRCRSLPEVLDLLLGGTLLGTPAGTYSDPDFLLWGLVAERLLGRPLAALLAESVLAPLALASVTPAPGDRPAVAESRMGTAFEVELARKAGLAIPDLGPPAVGRPQDGNSRFLMDPAGPGLTLCGHAGLFGRAVDLLRLGQEWLRPGRLLKPEAVRAALAGRSAFALGWWRRTLDGGGGGAALSPGSFGHTGFPGGNLWIDPRAGLVLVLCGHRLDPFGPINARRRGFHALVYDERGLRQRRRPA